MSLADISSNDVRRHLSLVTVWFISNSQEAGQCQFCQAIQRLNVKIQNICAFTSQGFQALPALQGSCMQHDSKQKRTDPFFQERPVVIINIEGPSLKVLRYAMEQPRELSFIHQNWQVTLWIDALSRCSGCSFQRHCKICRDSLGGRALGSLAVVLNHQDQKCPTVNQIGRHGLAGLGSHGLPGD